MIFYESEIWLPVFGYEGLYEVSTLGRIRSLDRFESFRNGTRLRKGRILSQLNATGGYLKVKLSKDSIVTNFPVHRLVALTFIFNGDREKTQVNHLDGDKRNNNVDNLEWVTPLENTKHAIDIGLKVNTHHPDRKLTDEQVMEIKDLLETTDFKYPKIAKLFDVSVTLIWQISNGLGRFQH